MIGAKSDALTASRSYVDRICEDKELDGMKALLLDGFTTKIVATAYSQTQILEKEVYLVQTIGKEHEPMRHLKAAIFVQPNEANITQLVKEVRNPRFSEYHIFFTNVVPHDLLVTLGKADEKEVVKQIHELYADYLPINEDLYHLGLSSGIVAAAKVNTALGKIGLVEQHTKGIMSFLLSMKRRPSDIRYQSKSLICRKVAEKIQQHLHRDDLFHFRQAAEPLLLILDRRDDPITPLLTQWTYQAMVHELLGLKDNRVCLSGAPGVSPDMQEIVLSSTQDSFYSQKRFANFGDLGVSVKSLMDDYQKRAKMNENISSVQDMQAFLDRYPQFRSKSINVSKHVALIGELARLTDVYKLFAISELEQDISCQHDQEKHMNQLMIMLRDPAVQPQDKLRLAMLMIIRYERNVDAERIKSVLLDTGVGPDQTVILDALVSYAGEAHRAPGLFEGGGIFASLTKQISTSINGVENVFTQHAPLLAEIMQAFSTNSLSSSKLPSTTPQKPAQAQPNELCVFIVGGATYEEAAVVAEFNAKHEGSMKVFLGASCMHNSTTFVKAVQKAYA
jgi:vacuolar protein sorting-associated protein 45